MAKKVTTVVQRRRAVRKAQNRVTARRIIGGTGLSDQELKRLEKVINRKKR